MTGSQQVTQFHNQREDEMGEAKRRGLGDESPFLVRSCKVGHRTVTFTFRRPVRGQAHCASVEWAPDMPGRGELTAAEWDQYRGGRDSIYAELADKAGLGRVLIVE